MKSEKLLFNFVTLFLLAITFSSCLSIKREIKVSYDGSGTETMTIKFDKIFYDMMGSFSSLMDSAKAGDFMDSLYKDEDFISKTRAKYDSMPGVKLLELYSHKNEDLSNSFIIKYEFDSLIKINSAVLNRFETPGNDDAETEINFDNKDGKVFFSYIYKNPKSDSAGVNGDSLSSAMSESITDLFKEGEVLFEIEFPYEIISSNATMTEGKKLIWKYSLAESMSKDKMILEAEMKP